MSWTAASGATSYNVKFSTTSGDSNPTVTNVTTTSLLLTGLVNGTTYYFMVSALNSGGESADSSEVSATPTVLVSGLTASVVNAQVQLQWNAYPGATGYSVKRALVSGGSYTILVTTSYADTTVGTCQTYYYVVTMILSSVESAPSVEASAFLAGGAPPSPWLNADIGSVGLAGSALYCNGQFTISGSGADIWGTADAFQFVYVYVPISTNCDIRARVLSVQSTHSNAKVPGT